MIVEKLLTLIDNELTVIQPQISDMCLGHRDIQKTAQPPICIFLAHDPGVVDPLKLLMGLVAKLPQRRIGKAAHGLQRVWIRHDIGVTGRVPGADIGHCSIPVRFAKSLSAAEHNMTATVAAQLAGAWQVAGSITPFLLFRGRKPPSFLSNQQVLSPCI